MALAFPYGLAGLAVLAYLPVAAHQDPWVNWGDPSTLSRLFDHLTGEGIREAYASEIGHMGSDIFVALARWCELAGGPVFPVVFLACACLLPAISLRWCAAAFPLGLLADLLFSVFINPMGQADLQTGVPGALALAFILATGLGRERARREYSWLWLVVGVVIVGWTTQHRWDDRVGDDLAGVSWKTHWGMCRRSFTRSLLHAQHRELHK